MIPGFCYGRAPTASSTSATSRGRHSARSTSCEPCAPINTVSAGSGSEPRRPVSSNARQSSAASKYVARYMAPAKPTIPSCQSARPATLLGIGNLRFWPKDRSNILKTLYGSDGYRALAVEHRVPNEATSFLERPQRVECDQSSKRPLSEADCDGRLQHPPSRPNRHERTNSRDSSWLGKRP